MSSSSEGLFIPEINTPGAFADAGLSLEQANIHWRHAYNGQGINIVTPFYSNQAL